MTRELSPGRLLTSFLEMKELVTELPVQVHRILDALSNRDLEVKVKTVDAPLVMEGLEKIANRITAGIILAALILGAAMLMRVETTFRILGYPGLAMLFFLAAVGGGAWLVLHIVMQDHHQQRPWGGAQAIAWFTQRPRTSFHSPGSLLTASETAAGCVGPA